MAQILFTVIAARLAAGFVLQNGGAKTEPDLREALRVRQYVLLNAAQGEGELTSLLATGFDNQESDVEVLGESAESIGQAASLDNAGFASVAATKNTAAMATFVRRLLDSQNMSVRDEAFMMSVLPYYTGECASQSFMALNQELLRARVPRSCHPAWIVRKDADELDADDSLLQPHTAKDMGRAALLLIRGVMAELGIKIQPRNFGHTWIFAANLVSSGKNLNDLKDQLANLRRFQNWTIFEGASHEPTFVDKGAFSSWLAEVGAAAPLNDDGYRAVVYTRNEQEMSSFIRRVAKHEGLKIVNDGALAGMTPYYSGLCARQSYDALVSELHSLVGRSFDMRFALEISSDNLPSVPELTAVIAQRTGVDVNKITIEDADTSKLTRRLDHHEWRQTHVHGQTSETAQMTIDQENAQSMVVTNPSPPHVAVDAARGSTELKGFIVTIAIDDASKVHEIKESLNTAALFPGQARTTIPRAHELESSKPTQCGGGLLLPK